MFHSSLTIAALLASAWFAAGASPRGHWPQFRGPNGSGVAEGEKPPIHFGPESNVVWRTAVPSGASSPCIWGDRIFLTGFDGDKLETICVSRNDGKTLWRKTVPSEKIEAFHKQDGSPAAATPVTDGKTLYAYFGSSGVIAYDFDGAEKWKAPLPTVKTFGDFGSGSSPILADGKVILNRDQLFDSHLLALDAETGKTAWKTERGQSYSWCTPVLWKKAGADEIILPGSLEVSAYDPEDGSRRWNVRGIAGAVCSTPVVGGGLLFVSAWAPQDSSRFRPSFEELLKGHDKDEDSALTRAELEGSELARVFMVFDFNKDKKITADEYNPLRSLAMRAQNVLVAIRPGGSGDVTDSHVVWKQDKGLPYVPSPLYYDGRVYLVKDGGMASCFDAKTGKTHYLQERPGVQGSYYASPTAADGRIYVPSLNGTVVVFKAGDSLEVLARNEFKERIFASPAVIDNTLYIRTHGQLYAMKETATAGD